MVTVTVKAITVKLSLADFEVSFVDVAEIVGTLFGDAGTVAGGVYITLLAVVALSEPQPGEQALPPAIIVQVTPEFVESFCTLAFKVTAAVPAPMVVILLVIVTEMG